MNQKKFFMTLILTAGILGFTACAYAETSYEWNDKLSRGVLNIIGSPVELARTIHIQSTVKGPAYGWTMGVVEGIGRALVRFGAGAIDTLTCPFDFPNDDKSPLLLPVYPWDEWDAAGL